MIPVVDKERNLLCFAYQDEEANRELRMLDELSNHKNVLGFEDVYPEYESVMVHGCNELAYQFVMYLKKLTVRIRISHALSKRVDICLFRYRMSGKSRYGWQNN